jgi:hypothetical protein
MALTTVLNLVTGDKLIYTCTPREAVIAAYAQSRGDFNAWDYEQRYGVLVKTDKDTYQLGDYSTFIVPTKF